MNASTSVNAGHTQMPMYMALRIPRRSLSLSRVALDGGRSVGWVVVAGIREANSAAGRVSLRGGCGDTGAMIPRSVAAARAKVKRGLRDCARNPPGSCGYLLAGKGESGSFSVVFAVQRLSGSI